MLKLVGHRETHLAEMAETTEIVKTVDRPIYDYKYFHWVFLSLMTHLFERNQNFADLLGAMVTARALWLH